MATYNLYPGAPPQIAADSDPGSVNLGTEFYVTAPAWVTHIRYLAPTVNGKPDSLRTGHIWAVNAAGDGGTLADGPYNLPANPAPGTWCEVELPAPFELISGQRYRVAIRHSQGAYAATPGYFITNTLVQGPVVLPNDTEALGGRQGSYTYSGTDQFPAAFGNAGYYSDVTITDTAPPAYSGGVTLHTDSTLTVDGTLATAGAVTMPSGTAFAAIDADGAIIGKLAPARWAGSIAQRWTGALKPRRNQ